MRHSISEKMDIPTEYLPLSEKGKQIVYNKQIGKIDKCFCSPYKRAIETANILFNNVVVLDNLHERIIGDATADFWYKQYCDYNYKNPGGESLNEVKNRMLNAITYILSNTSDGMVSLVISHATAICAYLLNYCTIEVINVPNKIRKILFNNKEILNGKINPTDYFIIKYEKDMVIDISFVSDNIK